MNGRSKHTGLGLALGAALGTVFAVAVGHADVWLAIGVGIGMALAIFWWRKELPSPRYEMHRLREELKAKSVRANS
jgi:predicted MFS family arabinose efflux permease